MKKVASSSEGLSIKLPFGLGAFRYHESSVYMHALDEMANYVNIIERNQDWWSLEAGVNRVLLKKDLRIFIPLSSVINVNLL